jgi:peptide/nickel transport system substrate-binding protein
MTLGFQANVYESLVIRDKDMKLTANLATEWENVEPHVWRFHLRRGVTFHNGNPFTADDVAFSVERVRSAGAGLELIAEKIEAVRVIDDHTVEFVTPRPDPILPLQLEIFYIMDREWAEEHKATTVAGPEGGEGDTYAKLNANGTGPFMVKERQPGVRTVLVPNPAWWGRMESNVSEAIFTPIDQDTMRVAALIAGEVDMAYPVPMEDRERLVKAQGVGPLTGPEARTLFLGFDQARDELLYSSVEGKNPFQDLRVRKAFFLAIDIEAINEKVMAGAARPAALMVAPQINGWSDALDQRPAFDPEQAKTLLDEAGYEEGFEVTLDCPNDRYVNDEAICRAVASMLAKVGVEVTVLAQTKSRYFTKVLAQNNYDTSFYLLGWTPPTFDAHNPLAWLMSCREDGMGAFNLGGYCNERVSELTKEIQGEVDPAKRQALIDEAFSIHLEEVGHIPLHQQPLSWGVRHGVSVNQRPDNVFDLRYVVVTD